jgi:hypothetical protein
VGEENTKTKRVTVRRNAAKGAYRYEKILNKEKTPEKRQKSVREGELPLHRINIQSSWKRR